MKLPGRDRRAVWLGLIASVGVIGYAGIVRPFRTEAQALTQRRDRAVDLLGRYDAAIQSREGILEFRRQLGERLEPIEGRMFGGPPEDAVSRLMALVERSAEANRVRLRRTAPLPPEELELGGFAVRSSVEGEADLAGVLRYLSALEASEKLLHVSHLRIVGHTGSFPDQSGAGLSFEFRVRGYSHSDPNGREE